MRVTMLKDQAVTVDGVNTIEAAEGETYEMGDGVAASLIAQGSAQAADPDWTTAPADPVDDPAERDELENKDAGAAEEAAVEQTAKPKAKAKAKA